MPVSLDQGRQLLLRWRDRPDVFAGDALGITPWSRQRELLLTVARHSHVAIRSGHKVGKSTSLAILALWWVLTRHRGIVLMSATAGHQVGNILWPEVERVYALAAKRGLPIGGHLSTDYHRGLQFPDGRRAFGLKPRRLATRVLRRCQLAQPVVPH